MAMLTVQFMEKPRDRARLFWQKRVEDAAYKVWQKKEIARQEKGS
jgi:hypothetical protein